MGYQNLHVSWKLELTWVAVLMKKGVGVTVHSEIIDPPYCHGEYSWFDDFYTFSEGV